MYGVLMMVMWPILERLVVGVSIGYVAASGGHAAALQTLNHKP